MDSERLEVPVDNTMDGKSGTFNEISWSSRLDQGSRMHKAICLIMRFLYDHIFASPIHWTMTRDRDPAVNLGPGGLSGIGLLTARNLDRHDVHTIVPGEKAKGGFEVSVLTAVDYEVLRGGSSCQI